MSDKSENPKEEESLSFDTTNASDDDLETKSPEDVRATAQVNRFQARSRRPKVDPSKQTNVISADDRSLKRLLAKQQDENFSTMSLGDKQEVVLLIRGMVERVVMEVGKTYKLGRFEIGAAADNEIDMTPYGAQDRGVSRHHASLEIIDGVVHIIDQKSTNGTFVNGKQLDPDEPEPLRKGDELILGKLALRVLFQ